MRIGNHTVVTPVEDPIGYPLDWRFQLAQAALEAADRSPTALVQDPDARALALRLHRRKSPLRDNEKPTRFDRVIFWRESGTGALLDPFLLAADTYEVAAAELVLPSADVVLYSCLFFDVRDERGVRRPAVLMRLKSELGTRDQDDAATRLRRIALTGGIHGLRRVLHACVTTTEPSLDELVEAELTRRLHAGELRTGDLVRLQANAIARQRVAQDAKTDGPTLWMEGMELVRRVLGITAPGMAQAQTTEERMASTTAAIKGRLAAQRIASAMPLTDNVDKGVEALNAMVDKVFKTESK